MSKKGGYKIIDFLNNDIETQSVIPGIYNNILDNKEKQLILSGIVFDDVLIDDCAVVSIGLDSDDNIIILANALKITITEDDEVTAVSFNLLNEIVSLSGDVEDVADDVSGIKEKIQDVAMTSIIFSDVPDGITVTGYFALKNGMMALNIKIETIEPYSEGDTITFKTTNMPSPILNQIIEGYSGSNVMLMSVEKDHTLRARIVKGSLNANSTIWCNGNVV